jgi:hypothetical protein
MTKFHLRKTYFFTPEEEVGGVFEENSNLSYILTNRECGIRYHEHFNFLLTTFK